MNPLVTIGIPVYNEELLVNETILSAINQTYKNLEIIISDNGSTDKTPVVIENLIKNDNRIRFIQHPKNNGVVYNFNYVKGEAKGDFFMWLGGHDIMSTGFVKEAVNFLSNNHTYSLFYPKTRYFDINNNEIIVPEFPLNIEFGKPLERAIFLYKNMTNCTAIHGLFRSKFIETQKLNNTGYIDVLILFFAALNGKIKQTEKFIYQRRKYRNESTETEMARFKAYGIITGKFDMSWHEMIKLNHLLYLANYKELPFKNKVEAFVFFTEGAFRKYFVLLLKFVYHFDFKLLKLIKALSIISYLSVKTKIILVKVKKTDTIA